VIGSLATVRGGDESLLEAALPGQYSNSAFHPATKTDCQIKQYRATALVHEIEAIVARCERGAGFRAVVTPNIEVSCCTAAFPTFATGSAGAQARRPRAMRKHHQASVG
jgi:hypothetical protein